MGQVFKAYDINTNRHVALKVLPAEFAANPAFRDRFQRESNLVAGLNEPHVIPIHAFGEVDGQLYLDMRLVDATDAESVLMANGAMDVARAVAIVDQVAAALDAASAVGVEHRDVKPANILITDRDFVYLIDFGIARAAGETGLTSTGMAIGTFAYMAPERFGAGTSDHRADVYSLACVLYQLLTNAQPFPGNSVEQQIAGHLHLPPPVPSQSQPRLPKSIDDVIARGMAKDPDQRYSTAGALAEDAHRALRGERIAASAPTQASPRGRDAASDGSIANPDRRRRHKALLPAAIAGGLAVAMGIGGAILFQERQQDVGEEPAALSSPTESAVPGSAAQAQPNAQKNVQVAAFTQIGDDVSIRLHNPNSDAGLIRSPYELTLLDDAGAVIATHGQGGLPGTYVNTIYHLPPNSDYGLEMTTPKGKTVASVEISTRGEWLDWKSTNSPTVAVTDPTIQDQSSTYGPTTTGRITLDKDIARCALVKSDSTGRGGSVS